MLNILAPCLKRPLSPHHQRLLPFESFRDTNKPWSCICGYLPLCWPIAFANDFGHFPFLSRMQVMPQIGFWPCFRRYVCQQDESIIDKMRVIKVARSGFWVTIPIKFNKLVYRRRVSERKSIAAATLEKDQSFRWSKCYRIGVTIVT